jgi:hypothetical protein
MDWALLHGQIIKAHRIEPDGLYWLAGDDVVWSTSQWLCSNLIDSMILISASLTSNLNFVHGATLMKQLKSFPIRPMSI